MKIIKEWRDSFYDSTNTIYELRGGVRLVHTIKPRSKEVSMGITIRGGSYFEKQVGVPAGTAHFLEHILNKPNRLLKTRAEYSKYIFGNRKQAHISSNAFTSIMYLSLTTRSHKSALRRIAKLNYARLDFPLEEIDQYMENEQKIILSELQRRVKPKSDKGVRFAEFIQQKEYPEFTGLTIGTRKSISKITAKDLRTFWKAIMKSNNIIISVQSDGEIQTGVMEAINRIAGLVIGKSKLKTPVIKLRNSLKNISRYNM